MTNETITTMEKLFRAILPGPKATIRMLGLIEYGGCNMVDAYLVAIRNDIHTPTAKKKIDAIIDGDVDRSIQLVMNRLFAQKTLEEDEHGNFRTLWAHVSNQVGMDI